MVIVKLQKKEIKQMTRHLQYARSEHDAHLIICRTLFKPGDYLPIFFFCHDAQKGFLASITGKI